MKSRVTIDARWLMSGIGSYIRHLLEGLAANGNGFEVHAITQDRHLGLVKKWCANVRVVNVPIYTLSEQWLIPRAAKGCHLLHVPHYNAPLLLETPLVVTIHDIIHITDPAYHRSFKAWAYARPILKLVAHRAQHVITVSEFSRRQIIESLGVPASKVTTIYNCADRRFSPIPREVAVKRVSTQVAIHPPYLLYVGNLKPHKNVPSLLEAFARLRARRDIPQRLLIVANGGPTRDEMLRKCALLGISARTTFISHVEQELLPHIYAAADALVMPSRVEGFGLPVLEAMSCGTPVICARAASLPELAADAAVYFDPRNCDELADAIERVLGSTELQSNLKKKGLDRAARFSCEHSIARHIDVYRAVLS